MTKQRYVDSAFLDFLTDLRRHNDRRWFEANKARYESQVRDRFLALIEALRPRLAKLRPAFAADPRPTGGSMMRIYRDIRFSKDKSPYKTGLAAHFDIAKQPGEGRPALYLHIGPGRSNLGGGVWRPETATLNRIRNHIVDHPLQWTRATTHRSFTSWFELGGESVKRIPQGFDAGHPLADDLRRKDFIFGAELDDRDLTSPALPDLLLHRYERAMPMMRFLADATTAAG